jgi:NADH-ubiquinone oxidoreductase chain 2
MSSTCSVTISIISLATLLFIFLNKEWLSMGTILVLYLFNS